MLSFVALSCRACEDEQAAWELCSGGVPRERRAGSVRRCRVEVEIKRQDKKQECAAHSSLGIHISRGPTEVRSGWAVWVRQLDAASQICMQRRAHAAFGVGRWGVRRAACRVLGIDREACLRRRVWTDE